MLVSVLNTLYIFSNKETKHILYFLLCGRVFISKIELKKPGDTKAKQLVQACTARRDGAGV